MRPRREVRKMAARNKPNEIYITRIYEAPVGLVWDAWTDPKQVAKWWGPRGFTITTHSKDLRPGGHWAYTMHGPDGTNYENKTIYHEVEKNARLVYDHGGNDDRPPLFRVTVTFAERSPGKTTMEMTMALESAEAAAQTKKFIRQASGNSTWDRLAEYLANDESFVINRSFPASIETLFEVWSNPRRFAQWLGPKGSTMRVLSGDVKVGDTLFYEMKTDGGGVMYGKIHYREVRPPYRLVYTQIFTDEKGNISRHPFAPTWPETMLTTVDFASEGENETRVTVTWTIHGEATDAERAAFQKEKPGMTQGWGGSFDKLDEFLLARK